MSWRRRRALVNTLGVYPFFWTKRFWQSFFLARAAIRHHAYQKLAELAPLIALLEGRHLRTVAEIGTAGGGTLYLLSRLAADDATIISIDLPGNPFDWGYSDADVERFRSYRRPGQRLSLVRADSQADSTRDDVVRELKGRDLDLLLIDGDHSYSGVKRDFELYAPLVAPGGLVIFHDILHHPGAEDVQVDVLWDELKGDYRHYEFIDADDDWGHGPWGGIGVLEVPGPNAKD